MIHKLCNLCIVFIKITFCFTIFFTSQVLSDENPNNFIKFTTDFDAKCVNRGGVMIYISNTHPKNTLKVTLERWFMDFRTGDRGRSILYPGVKPEALGCSKVSNGKQEWKIKKAEWVKK